MDPTAAKRNGPAWDSSWSGHYELTYHITGELVVRGKRYVIDCVDTGDRSWGPRPERDNSPVIWWHASMGGELEVTDIRGKQSLFTYSTVNSCLWAPYPSNTYLQASMRVNHDGKRGYGVQQMGLSRAYLTRHRDAIRARY